MASLWCPVLGSVPDFQVSGLRVEVRGAHCGVLFSVKFQVSRFPGFRVEVRGAPQLPRPGHCWAPALYIVVDHFYSFQKKQLLT